VLYVRERCHRCGADLTGVIPNYFAIDSPFVACRACGALNDRSLKATEWRLMSLPRKFANTALTYFWSCGIALLVVVAGNFVAQSLWPDWSQLASEKIDVTGFAVAAVAVLCLGAMLAWFWLNWRSIGRIADFEILATSTYCGGSAFSIVSLRSVTSYSANAGGRHPWPD
jgi:hypothetical protein